MPPGVGQRREASAMIVNEDSSSRIAHGMAAVGALSPSSSSSREGWKAFSFSGVKGWGNDADSGGLRVPVRGHVANAGGGAGTAPPRRRPSGVARKLYHRAGGADTRIPRHIRQHL